MNEDKLRKAFAAIKVDMDKTKSQLDKIERNVNKKPQKDKEIEQILSILQSLKSETYENTKRVEALNTIVNPNTAKQETKSYQKDIDSLTKRLDLIEKKAPAAPTTTTKTISATSIDNEQKIENTFNEFSEIMNEKMQIEMNSLRLEFTEEIAKLYDKCFNEIINLKAEVEKSKKVTPSPRTAAVKKARAQKEVEQKEPKVIKEKKESKLKKISKFLFVDEDEEDLKSIKNQVEEKDKK